MKTMSDPHFWANTLAKLGVREHTADDWCETFASLFNTDVFSSQDDLPNFLAQVLHESAYLEKLEENLNYSAERLMKVWPRRFPDRATAKRFEHRPIAIANRVYGNRLGNTEPGDGWRYRGRGLIQITGRQNYELMEALTGFQFVDNPDLLLEQEPSLRASICWWEESVPDTVLSDVQRVTRVVNGGKICLSERTRLTERARDLLRELV